MLPVGGRNHFLTTDFNKVVCASRPRILSVVASLTSKAFTVRDKSGTLESRGDTGAEGGEASMPVYDCGATFPYRYIHVTLNCFSH